MSIAVAPHAHPRLHSTAMILATCSEPRRRPLAPEASGNLWAIVLAGERPAASLRARSRLGRTLDCVARLIPPERTVVVTRPGEVEGCDLGEVHVLHQPADRGSAAAVLLPSHWIQARDPAATVAVMSTAHVILEADPFMRRLADAAAYTDAHPEWIVLLGAPPSEPHPGYGWIEPGEPMAEAGAGALHRVRRFRERPTEESARRLFATGGLWSTFTFTAGVSALVEAGRERVPLLHDRLVRLGVFVGTRFELWALRQAYLFAPTADFSRAILESSPLPLAVTPLPALTWCDLAKPVLSGPVPSPEWADARHGGTE